MPYTGPDVNVTMAIPVTSPVIQPTTLQPLSIGAHYLVKLRSYVGEFAATGVSSGHTFSDLPKSANDTAADLKVASDDFLKFTLVTEQGLEIDVTSKFALVYTGGVQTFDRTVALGAAGSVYVDYRALNDRFAGTGATLLRASSAEDLINIFGADNYETPANPLGFAMYLTVLAGTPAAGIAISAPEGTYTGNIDNEVAAHQAAAEYAKVYDLYMPVPLSQSPYVFQVWRSHCTYMSNIGKNERRMIGAPDMGSNIIVRAGSEFEPWFPITAAIEAAQILLNGNEPLNAPTAIGSVTVVGGYEVIRTATGVGTATGTFYIRGFTPTSSNQAVTLDGGAFVIAYSTTLSGPVLVELEDSAIQPQVRRVKVGDSFTFPVSGASKSATVAAVGVAGNERLVRVTIPATAGYVPASGPFAFRRELNILTQRADFINGYKQTARSFTDQRLSLVMPEYVGYPINGAIKDVPSYFYAVALAAEVCKVGRQPAGAVPGALPVGLFTESVEHLFKSVRFFSKVEIDEIAGAGWTVLVNRLQGLPLTTYDTVTTDATSIETHELILGVERDFVARTIREKLRERLRLTRITNETLSAAAIAFGAIAASLTRTGGPSQVMRSITLLSVAQDPENPDTIVFEAEGTHLYPYKHGQVNFKIVL